MSEQKPIGVSRVCVDADRGPLIEDVLLSVAADLTRAVAVPDDSSDGYAIQDAASGSIILQARRVDWDGGDEE